MKALGELRALGQAPPWHRERVQDVIEAPGREEASLGQRGHHDAPAGPARRQLRPFPGNRGLREEEEEDEGMPERCWGMLGGARSLKRFGGHWKDGDGEREDEEGEDDEREDEEALGGRWGW